MRFGLVGGSGVVVNLVVLLGLVEFLQWPVLVASLVAIEVATVSNWFLNRHWTWKDRDDTAWHSLARYHAVAVVGMGIQWVILAAVLATTSWHYVAGTILGVAAATAWNFAGNHLVSFRDRNARPLPRWTWYAGSAAAQLTLAALFAHPWDTFVFQRTVEDLLLRGLTPYAVAEQAPAYVYWGGALPALPMWYAYPPVPLAFMAATTFPHTLGWLPWDWVGRVLIRLPFIAATLALAPLARHLIATAPGATAVHQARGQRLERHLLGNPLFLVIAAIWGQFEALILVLLLLSVLALRHSHYGRSGAWWALAVCVKIFPLYLVPLLALHLHRVGGRRAVARFAAVAAAVGAAINLPFFLLNPRGFLQQVLLMHGERSPARLAPLAYINQFLDFLSEAWPQVMPSEAVWSSWLGTVSLVLVITLILALTAASTKGPATEGRLLEWMALTFLGGLLATKVLNEQYLLLPFGLLLVAAIHPQASQRPGWTTFVRISSWGVVAAGLLAGFNLLYAVPEPMARAVFGGLAPEVIGNLAATLGVTTAKLKSILAWSTGLFLLAPALYAVHRLWRPVATGLLVVEHALADLARNSVRRTRPVALLATVLILCTAPLGVALASGTGAHAEPRPLASGERWVLAEVTTSWYNPSNDGERAAGTWEHSPAQPETGYYSLNAHAAQGALRLIDRAGFDGIVIQSHPYYPGYANTLRRVAEANGMPYALGLDLADGRGPLALEASTANAVRASLDAPTVDYWSGRMHIVAPDGQGYVVILRGVEHVQPQFTASELRFVLDAWLATQPDPQDVLNLQAVLPPQNAADLAADTPAAALWRSAYAAGAAAWWTRALGTNVPLQFLADAPLPGGAWLGPSAANEPRALESPSVVRFTTLDGLLAPDTVRPAWVRATWSEADGVIVPWNDYKGLGAVEPTREHGRATLEETARFIAAFKAPPASVTVSEPEPGLAEQVTELLPERRPAQGEIASRAVN